MKSSGIGGQAVIEGVMMKNKDEYAIAVRKPDQEIIVEKKAYQSFTSKHKVFGLPVLRGVVAFIESLVIGMKVLSFSASFYEEEEEIKQKPAKSEKHAKKMEEKKKKKEKNKERDDAFFMGVTITLSILLAILIFIMLPLWLSSLLKTVVESNTVLAILEGIIRLGIFIAYIAAISQMKDIKRVFMYHGAEHKTINCVEHGYDLTVENVRKQSKEHKRCGTSFMLFVIIISSILFMFIRVDNILLKTVIRLLLVPVIAGISYEVIRLAGRSESKIVAIISKPGLWLQGLTTKEPDDSMIEVAIQSVEAVFDWRAYLEEVRNEANDQMKTTMGRETAATMDELHKSF